MRWPSFMMAQVGEGLGILFAQYINDRLLNILTTVCLPSPSNSQANSPTLPKGG